MDLDADLSVVVVRSGADRRIRHSSRRTAEYWTRSLCVRPARVHGVGKVHRLLDHQRSGIHGGVTILFTTVVLRSLGEPIGIR